MAKTKTTRKSAVYKQHERDEAEKMDSLLEYNQYLERKVNQLMKRNFELEDIIDAAKKNLS
jgi:hypothetical protein